MKIIQSNLLTDERIELDPHTRIEFGSGLRRITVSVIDGMLHISGDGALAIFPRAANLVHVASER